MKHVAFENVSESVCTHGSAVMEYELQKEEKMQSTADVNEIKEWKLASLRNLKEAQLHFQLFYVLENCEPEDMTSLTLTLYEEELQQGAMTRTLLFLILGHLDEDTRKKYAEQYFRAETTDAKKSQILGYNVARTMHKWFVEIEDYYMLIVRAICEAISPDRDGKGEIACAFLDEVEHRLKVLEKKDGPQRMYMISMKRKEAYFIYLRDRGAYKAANSFLDRFWEEDPEDKLFGSDLAETAEEEEQRIKAMLYYLPSPELLAWGKKYIQKKREYTKGEEYTHEQWCKEIDDVPKENRAGSDDEWVAVNKWLDVSKGINHLKNNQWDDSVLKELGQKDRFDVEKHSYMTEMCCQLAVVIQSWMGVTMPELGQKAGAGETVDTTATEKVLDDKQLIDKLDSLKDKNLFSYGCYGKYIAGYRGYGNLKKVLNEEGLKERLYSVADLEHLVYLYFHTPLWIVERFYTFVQKLSKRVRDTRDTRTVESLLDKYVFAGRVVSEDKWSAVSPDRFRLLPRDLNWKSKSKKHNMGNGKKEKKPDWAYLFIEPTWLEENQGKVNGLSIRAVRHDTGEVSYPPMPCTFKVVGFSQEKGKKARLLIKDVFPVETMLSDDSEEAEVLDAKKVFKRDLKDWFAGIRREKRFFKWDERVDDEGKSVIVAEPLKVYPEKAKWGEEYQIIFTKAERIGIATRFLVVVEELAAAGAYEELEMLLKHCSFRPLANVNEFRYIEVQHWTNFSLTKRDNKVRELWKNKAVNLMNNRDIPAELRLEIYMNTCIRKVYPLEGLLQKAEFRKLLFEKDTEWIVPVRFDEYKEQDGKKVRTLFSMNPVLKSKYDKRRRDYVFVPDREKRNVILSKCVFYYDGEVKFPEEKLPATMKAPEGVPNERLVIFATMESMEKDGYYIKSIKLRECFFDSEEVKRNFPWREYKKCFYDLKKLVPPRRLSENHEQERKWLNEQMLNIYDNLQAVENFSMEKEHKHTPMDKCYQIVSEMNEVFTRVTHNNEKFDISMCYDIVLLLGKKNAFMDSHLFEHLSKADAEHSFDEFLSSQDLSEDERGIVFRIENLRLFGYLEKERQVDFIIAECRKWYLKSYENFMAGIDDKDPNHINIICAVFYLSHLQLLVEEDVFIKDVIKKHSNKGEEEVRNAIEEYKKNGLAEDIMKAQGRWKKKSEKHAAEVEAEKAQYYEKRQQQDGYREKENKS